MTRLTSILLSFLTIALGSTSFGQGRVDTDSILYKTWWTAQKIDMDTSLKHFVKEAKNQSSINIEITYFNTDSVCKVLKLTQKKNGTELITFYFAEKKPILISVARNNFLLLNKSEVFKAVSSFNTTTDTLSFARPLYYKQFEALYYFYNLKARYTSVATYTDKGIIKNVRHNDKIDINDGMKLFDKAEQYVLNRK